MAFGASRRLFQGLPSCTGYGGGKDGAGAAKIVAGYPVVRAGGWGINAGVEAALLNALAEQFPGLRERLQSRPQPSDLRVLPRHLCGVVGAKGGQGGFGGDAGDPLYDSMIGSEREFWPHHQGWNGKNEPFKAKVRERMKLALEAASLAPPSPAQEPGTGDTGEEIAAALANCAEAVAFFEQVKRASSDEQIAVGADHWNWLEAACRRAAALATTATTAETRGPAEGAR